MTDPVLIILPCIFAVLVVAASIYFVIYFQHPDDKWVAWFPKVIVVLGLSMSIYNVLLLPLDVANQGGNFEASGGLPMGYLTLSFFLATVIMAVIFVPFTMFYYEGMDEKDDYDADGGNTTKQVFYAVKWSTVTIGIFLIASGVMWYKIGKATFEITQQNGMFQDITGEGSAVQFCSLTPKKVADLGETKWCSENSVAAPSNEFTVSFIMYTVAIASFIGWLFFSVFGGVGLPALPFDLLMEFKHRPRPIKLMEYTEKKKLIGEQATMLLRASQALNDEIKAAKKSGSFRKLRKMKKLENEFKKDVLYLEMQYKKLENAYKNGGGNPLYYWSVLFIGIIGTFLSIFWFIHILVFVLPIITAPSGLPLTPFLNSFFENTFSVPFIGILFYGIFIFWLLACVVKGVTKMGLRFMFISVHPLKIGETMMSSMVFNVGLILFSTLAVTQFCTISFQYYARYTSSWTIFGNQIHHLYGINYVYSAFIYILPIMAFITLIYIWAKPYDYKTKPII